MGRVLRFGLSIAAFSFVLCVQQANADPVFIDGPPDTGDHSWCTANDFSHPGFVGDSATDLETWTVVDAVHQGDCGEHTDVRWTNGATGGAYGMAECRLWKDNGSCDHYLITINNSPINAEPYPAAQRRKTFCHELGHTVGVSHYWSPDLPDDDELDSCLRSGPAGEAAYWHTRYGSHHRIDHINPWFN